MKTLLTVSLLLGTSLMLLFLYLGDAQAASKTEDDLETRITALEDAIDLHLEELKVHEQHILDLEALQWTDGQRAIDTVGLKLWERGTTCVSDGCYQGDPMLQPFYNVPAYNRATYIGELIGHGSWTWEQTSASTWLVTATHQDGTYYNFVVDTVHNFTCWDQSNWCTQ
jgi:hypothetical protein